MSLRKGVKRRRGVVALTAVGALFAFQALAIVGAQFASAVTDCNYNSSTDTVEITIDPGQFVDVAVDTTADDLDPAAPAGAILANENGAGYLACGSASNSNVVSIVVLGSTGTNEDFTIDEESGDTFNTAIAWHIDLGTGDFDDFDINLNCDQDNTVVLTNTSFDLNTAVGELLGAEFLDVHGCDGDDTVDASAATIDADLRGGDGDDFLSPGTHDGDDIDGDGDDDTLNYGGRTTAMAVVNGTDAGTDANADGDNDDVGDEEDFIDCFETVITGSGNDTIDDDGCGDSVYQPGLGDDDVVGESDDDTIDWSTSAAGVVIDAINQTATGQGADTWEEAQNFIGSGFDDTLLVDDDAPFAQVDTFSGLGGVDTVDASAATAGVDVNLDILDPSGADDLENIIGSAFNDELDGNDVRNQINAGDGDDFLDGQPGNDTLLGEGGNDTYQGGTGADRVSFANSPQKVTVDLSLGFATGEGDDSFVVEFAGDGVEIILGSAFNDAISGGPFGGGGTVNFLFVGKAGNDTLTGFSGNDTLKGGGGNDTQRGVGGDDTMLGAAGNDRLFGGGGTDIGKGGKGNDTCSKVEIKTSCGKKGNPASPQTGIAGRLS